MNLLRVKALIFDFDGTLAVLNIDFYFMKDRVFELIDRFGVDGGLIKERYLLEIIDEVYSILLDRNVPRPAPGGMAGEFQKGSPDSARFYQEAHRVLHEVEMRAAEKGKLLPGAKRTLKSLREKGMRLGIVTRNCEEAVRKIFPGIDDFCDVFVSRDSVKRVKPHPDHLTHVIHALDVSPEETLMVGDHIIDIQAGKRAGMKTIGVLTGRTKKEEFEQAGADYVFKDVSEVEAIV
jgi:phosphoglycolate phosphatase